MSTNPRMILIDQDLKDLTGYERPKDQRRWLDMHGIKYAVRKDGTLSTTLDLINAGLLSDQASNLPNFEALNGR